MSPHRALTPLASLPRQSPTFSATEYWVLASEGRNTPVTTDLMSWVVPTPRRCIASSRTAR